MTLIQAGLLAVGLSLIALALLFGLAWPKGKPCICDDADNNQVRRGMGRSPMTVRRMTLEDYAEAGVAPPPEFIHVARPWSLDDLVGMRFTARVSVPNNIEVHSRCEECGDEEGECSCADE